MLSNLAIRTTTISSSSAFINQHQFHHQLAPYLSSQNEQQADIDITNKQRQHISAITIMPNGIKKENLPTKVCVVCGRPFNWRKKWERVWDEVTTCSKSCNKKRKKEKNNRQSNSRNNLNIDEGDDNVVVAAALVESNDLDGESLNDVVSTINNNGRLDTCDDEDDIILALKFAQDTTIHDHHDEDNQSTTKSISSISSPNNNTDDNIIPLDAKKQQRKLEKKRKKAERRAQRQGKGDPTAGQKQCTICNTSVNLLIRCTYDKSGQWGMVCGKCWNDVR